MYRHRTAEMNAILTLSAVQSDEKLWTQHLIVHTVGSHVTGCECD